MKRVGVFCLCMAAVLAGGYAATGEFERVESVPAGVTAVTVDGGRVYAAAGNDLFVRAEGRKRFRQLVSIKGGDAGIRYLLGTSEGLLIAGSTGLYRMASDAASPETLWRQPRAEEGWSGVYHVLEDRNRLYLSTDSGVYVRAQREGGFTRMDVLGRDTAVYWTQTLGPDVLICATSGGVYRIAGDGQDVRRVFAVRDGIDEDTPAANVPRTILVREHEVWVGTDDGLLYSSDAGMTFSRLFLRPLMNAGINGLADIGEGILLVAGDRGAFRIDADARVSAVDTGAAAVDVNALAPAGDGVLYLAADSGLYTGAMNVSERTGSGPAADSVRLPDIHAVQEAAMRYNDVHPDTIRRWRRRANYQALFPSLDLNYDKTLYGTYSGGGQCYVGPVDWSVGLSWDLGDLIFNDEQNDIDTRSKLRTQLRADILDEVNRLYFEYKRTLLELHRVQERIEREEKQLHLEQLAASLDAYTGGFFTRSP